MTETQGSDEFGAGAGGEYAAVPEPAASQGESSPDPTEPGNPALAPPDGTTMPDVGSDQPEPDISSPDDDLAWPAYTPQAEPPDDADARLDPGPEPAWGEDRQSEGAQRPGDQATGSTEVTDVWEPPAGGAEWGEAEQDAADPRTEATAEPPRRWPEAEAASPDDDEWASSTDAVDTGGQEYAAAEIPDTEWGSPFQARGDGVAEVDDFRVPEVGAQVGDLDDRGDGGRVGGFVAPEDGAEVFETSDVDGLAAGGDAHGDAPETGDRAGDSDVVEPSAPDVPEASSQADGLDQFEADFQADDLDLAGEGGVPADGFDLAGEGDHASDADGPVAEGAQAPADGIEASVEGSQPLGEDVEAPREGNDASVEDGQAPGEGVEAPVEGIEVLPAGSDASVEDSPAFGEGVEVLREGSDASAEGSETSGEGREAPAVGGEVLDEGVEAYDEDSEAPAVGIAASGEDGEELGEGVEVLGEGGEELGDGSQTPGDDSQTPGGGSDVNGEGGYLDRGEEGAGVVIAMPPPPETGERRVDEAVAALQHLGDRPTEEHVGAYDATHNGLQDVLADLDRDPDGG